MKQQGALLATWLVRSEGERVWISKRTLEHAMWAGASRQAAWEVAIAVAELVSNAVRYAGGGTVELWLEGPQLVVIVRDDGRGFKQHLEATEELPGAGMADSATYHAEKHGLGIGLETVRRMMSAVRIESGPGGTTVRASKLLKR